MAKRLTFEPAPEGLSDFQKACWEFTECEKMVRRAKSKTTKRKYDRRAFDPILVISNELMAHGIDC